MILAAGLGSRLGQLSLQRPKPMLPICGVPLVRWSVLWLRAQGVREIVINLHHLGHQIEAALGDGKSLGVAIAYSRENEMLLGTGGGLRHARHLLDDGSGTPIVVVNGKILTDLELPEVLFAHKARNAAVTMVLRPMKPGETYGRLRCDSAGHIQELLGTCTPKGGHLSPKMYTGVMVLQPEVLARIPEEGPSCIVRTACKDLFAEEKGLFGHVYSGYWWEHSTAERYLQGVANVLSGQATLAYRENPLTGIHPSAQIHPTAQVAQSVWMGPEVRIGARARIGPHTQLGPGAVIAPGVHVQESIVWGHVRVTSDLRQTIVAGEADQAGAC